MLGAICCEVGLEYKELVQEKDYASISTNICKTNIPQLLTLAILKSSLSLSLSTLHVAYILKTDKVDIILKSLEPRLAPIPLSNWR